MGKLKAAFSLSFPVLSKFSTINMHDYLQKKKKRKTHPQNHWAMDWPAWGPTLHRHTPFGDSEQLADRASGPPISFSLRFTEMKGQVRQIRQGTGLGS